MRVFKTKGFDDWATEVLLSDKVLRAAVREVEQGLNDGSLGGSLYKKRVATGNKGKRGGIRTLIAFKYDDRAFFIYGFKKNVRENVSPVEVKALKEFSKVLMGYSVQQLDTAVAKGKLVEVI